MASDEYFEYLNNNSSPMDCPNTEILFGSATLMIRVDADCEIICDEKSLGLAAAGQIITEKISVGEHRLKFISLEDNNICIERVEKFSEAGVKYSIVISNLSKMIANKKIIVTKSPSELTVLGENFLLGNECRVDYKEALFYLTEAAECNNLRALYLISRMYLNGQGCDKSMDKALMWALRGMERKDPDCTYMVWLIYKEKGDLVQANKALYDAAEMGHIEACYLYGRPSYSGDFDRLPYLEHAADCGHNSAMFEYAEFIFENRGSLRADDAMAEKAYNFCFKLANKGDKEAMFLLSKFIGIAYGCRFDLDEMLKWKKLSKQP